MPRRALGFCAILTLAGSPLAAQQRPASPPRADSAAQAPDTAPSGSPLVMGRETVLVLTERVGSFTAAERAAAIEARIRRAASGGYDSVVIRTSDVGEELLAGDEILMVVTDADARAAGRPRAELAAALAAAIQGSLRRAGLLAVLQVVTVGALWTLLASLVLLLALRLLGRAYPRVCASLERGRSTWMPSLRVQRFELMSKTRLTAALLAVARGLRVVLVLLLLYFYVPLVLSFFPWTAPVSDRVLSYVTTPLTRLGAAAVAYLPNVFFIAIIVLVARWSLRLVRLFFDALERGAIAFAGFEREWAEPTYKIVRFLLIAFGVVILFPYLPGSRSEAFRGVSLFLGVLFSLGSSGAIANIVAGVVLTYTRAFSVGDRVKIGDNMGDVVAKTLLVTRIRTIKNVDITIPNGIVLGTHILNYSAMARDRSLILHTGVTIGYDAPWRKVHELLIAAARATPGILTEPEPFVLQTSLDDSYVAYEINAHTDRPELMAQTCSDLHANIQDRFNEAGVEILSPHYRALRDGNPVAIPASYVPKDDAAPAFRVRRVEDRV